MNDHRPRRLTAILLVLIALITACDSDSGSSNPVQPFEPLPSELIDNLGVTWQCAQNAFSAAVSGQVILEAPLTPVNTDVVHLMLLERVDDQLTTLSTFCVNNMADFPLNFALTYMPDMIKNEARYFVSATYFRRIDGNLYDAVRMTDGYTEVISSGVSTGINLRLEAL